ncbi:MAG: sensor histidine kinase [Actinomycetota bacterium]|nr:sensor histidine kinase [Actinomycetota bacterium]
MNTRSRTLLGRGLVSLGFVAVIGSLPFVIADARVFDNWLNPLGVAIVVIGLVWLLTGAMIVSRQPGNWAGWIFCIIGLAVPFATSAQSIAVYGLKVNPGSIPVVGLFAWVAEFGLYPLALVPLLFLLFPDGRPPSRRWRLAIIGLLAGTAAAILGYVVRPGAFNNLRDYVPGYRNPFGVEALRGFADVVIGAGAFVALVCGFMSVLAIRGRFKRSTGDERQPMRWLAFVGVIAGTFFVLTVVAGFFGGLILGPNRNWPIFPVFGGLTFATIALGVPAAYAVAIFRYRLYDLDLVIRKTVIFGVLAVFITAVYALVVGGVGMIVGSRSSTVSSFAAAAVLAVAFQPVRDRARRFADRVVYGRRATPYEVLAEFSDRMSETYATDDVLPRMAQILARGTGAQIACVWLRVGNELRPAASTDEMVSAPKRLAGDTLPGFPPGEHAVEVRHQGDLLGALSVVMPISDPMNPAKDKLVRDLAAQAGLVLRNVRLIEELRASRQRLVAAQDEERRKIERNLHDGAQQQLVALQVKLRLAEGLLERDAAQGQEAIAALQADTNAALENLRDLARGIYPPLLADKGIVAALEAQARKSTVPTSVEAGGLGRYAPEVEATIYFCTLEALQNVSKYAAATRTLIRLGREDGRVTFEIEDDGVGFDAGATDYGTGLRGMADRLDAIGGSLDVRSARGQGTTITGRVPVAVVMETA